MNKKNGILFALDANFISLYFLLMQHLHFTCSLEDRSNSLITHLYFSFVLETHKIVWIQSTKYYLIGISCFHHTLDSTHFFTGWTFFVFFACYDYFMSLSVFFEDSRN